MALTREQILAARVASEPVSAPELGGDGQIIVSELTGLEADRLDAANYQRSPDGRLTLKAERYNARWFIATVRGGDGKAMFGPGDIELVAGLPNSLLERVVKVAHRLNGVGGEAERAILKNSSAGQPGEPPAG